MPSDVSFDVNMTEQDASSFRVIKQNLAQGKRTLVNQALLFFLGAMVAAGILWLGWNPWLRSLQLLLFVALGYMYVRSLHSKLAFLVKGSQITYTILLFLIVLLASFIINLVIGFISLWLMLTAGTAFLVPYSLLLAWHAFEELPSASPPLWFYNESPEMKQGVVSLHTMPIQVKVEEQPCGATKRTVSFSAPGRMKLGIVLYNILREQNAPGEPGIPYKDEQGSVYGWGFQKSILGIFHTWLNPELSLIENNIKPNNVIIAKRILYKPSLPYPEGKS